MSNLPKRPQTIGQLERKHTRRQELKDRLMTINNKVKVERGKNKRLTQWQ